MQRIEMGYNSDGSNAVEIQVDSVATTMHYTAGVLDYVECVVPTTGTYRRTFSYTDGLMTGKTVWVKQ